MKDVYQHPDGPEPGKAARGHHATDQPSVVPGLDRGAGAATTRQYVAVRVLQVLIYFGYAYGPCSWGPGL